MTELQIVGVIILVVIVLLIIFSAVNRIVQDREMDTAIQDSYSYTGTGDPQFDEVATIAQELIDDFRKSISDTEQYIERAKETSTEILEMNLGLQRLEIQLDLLGKINTDNVIQKYPHQRLDWWSVAATIHYARRIIGEMT